jgi:Tol biopolymer transport system component
MRYLPLAVATAAAFVSTVVLATAADATAPGANGKIAFRTYFDAQQSWGAVFTISADGGGAKQLTQPRRGTVDDQPFWAPDGSLIAFSRLPEGGLSHVWVMAPDGSGPRPVGPLCRTGENEQTCPDDAGASFSPDSQRIAFTQSTGRVRHDRQGEDWIEHSALAVMNRDGSARRVVYQGAPFSGDLGYPVFSPSGRQLVFERHVSSFGKPAGRHAVYVIGVDGSGFRRLTPWVDDDGDNPDWSPNGKWILFHSHVDDPSRQSQYFLIRPDGSGRKQITHFRKGTHVASASFSPDGRSIVFAKGQEGGNVDVYTMRLDGSHVRRITRSPLWQSAPAWGPR